MKISRLHHREIAKSTNLNKLLNQSTNVRKFLGDVDHAVSKPSVAKIGVNGASTCSKSKNRLEKVLVP